MSLEEKLLRIQEIQLLLEQKKVKLSESMILLEEAYGLKQEIEKELSEMENKLINLSSENKKDEDSPF